MGSISCFTSVIKWLLLVIFLFNTGVVGGLHDLLTTTSSTSEESAAHEVLRGFTAEKLRNAERKTQAKQVYSEEDYFVDLADIFRKMMELELKPGIPNGINFLRGYYHHGAVLGKHDEIAKVIYQHKDIELYFQSSESLVKRGDLQQVPNWLWNMYVKNFCIALLFLLLESRAYRLGMRNPFSFILLLVFYPVSIGFIFYKWFRLQGRSYIAETEYRRTKEKLFTLLSRDEVAHITKFAKSNASLASFKNGLVFRHSFALALLATVVITVLPNQAHAEKECVLLSDGGITQVELHLARMDIEDDDTDTAVPKWCIYNAWEFVGIKLVVGLVFLTKPFHIQEPCFEIDHVPLFSRYECLLV